MKSTENPLLAEWNTPHGVPPFSDVNAEHFSEAFEKAFDEYRTSIDAIADNPAPADFENTIVALEHAEAIPGRVAHVFFNLAAADTSDELQKIEREISPELARQFQQTSLNEKLFARIDDLKSRSSELGLTDEEARLLERVHTKFIRAGARLSGNDRVRIGEITEQLAKLGTEFSQNVLSAENEFKLLLENEDDLKGLPDFLKESAAQTASDLGHSGQHVITLSRSSIEPFLQYSERRDLREEAFIAWTSRGNGYQGVDNRAIAEEMISLRDEFAKLLEYENYAHYRLDDVMARSAKNVRNLLNDVWGPARSKALDEHEKLTDLARNEGANIELAPWDWRFYAEKQRKLAYDIDEAEAKPYFTLDKMVEAAFDTANRLFGLEFSERSDVKAYHPDVRVFEVKDNNGEFVALFMGDYFARPSKRSGAWMSMFRRQEKLKGNVRPIVVNVMNFIKGGNNEPALLTFDDARTLFHEFGHALHSMLSDVTYSSLSGTSVARDFVELPSQLFEHWLSQPQVLKKFATHYQTGEPIPDELLAKLLKAREFNQGFATVEYVSSAMVDLELHSTSEVQDIDIMKFEEKVLDTIDMPPAITVRHSVPHFSHIFSGDGYSSAYYSYLWSEVMDADAFRAFEEKGDPFDSDTAARLRDTILSVGNSIPPEEAYRNFRGRLPEIDAMLEKKGLA